MEKIVIAGGGFAGVNLAMGLLKNKAYEIVLVDRNNYNYFSPLLYQVSTAFLEPSSICYPFRKLFRDGGISYRLGEIVKIDTSGQILVLSDGEIAYDHLIIATGAAINYFGNESIRQNAIPMKTVDDALQMRNTIVKRWEKAAITTDPVEKQKLLNMVVAGGGPTGVEVAGMLAEIKKFILAREYPEFKAYPCEIYLVDGGPSLLRSMSAKTQKHAENVLSRLHVKIKLNTTVSEIKDGYVKLSNGEAIEAYTLIWAAGVTVKRFDGIPEDSFAKTGRMFTDEFHRVKGVKNIYAIGDCAIQTHEAAFPNGHPQQAQTAIQHGTHLAKNFTLRAAGKVEQPFRYNDKGELVVIGRNQAAGDLFKVRFHVQGYPALFLWLFVHLTGLLNPANRMRTLNSWIVAYLSRDQALRMIFRSKTE
jgi:NADH dehydrogenase